MWVTSRVASAAIQGRLANSALLSSWLHAAPQWGKVRTPAARPCVRAALD